MIFIKFSAKKYKKMREIMQEIRTELLGNKRSEQLLLELVDETIGSVNDD